MITWRDFINDEDYCECIMIKYEKMHTIEVSESELARALFIMRLVNGEVLGVPLTSIASEKLGLGMGKIGGDTLLSKVNELAKKLGVSTCIDYYYIQHEWEAFLGIGDGESIKNKDILNKIARVERDLAELKGML